MENIYIVVVVILFALAISDLIVGVSNDAVNFLNSAIGSKAAPFKVIMVIAALGILVGATFSSGMMEVARKSIFHPEHFYFREIMIIFLAVMITDVILLDFYNTFGLPTSTTVSIVFELLGAAVAISLIKISNAAEGSANMSNFINSGRALLIISGILLSVFVAFSVGTIVQYITRLIFSFNYKRTLKYFGSLWGGIAITAITYFILIKGAKGSSFMSKENLDWIRENTLLILVTSLAGWTVIMQLLIWLFKLNILKLIVLIGTFALAMAFAGNDLVNFIGVPLAGFASFISFNAQDAAGPDSFLMSELQGDVSTPTMFLLIAGLIMVITLWLSRKAKSVVKTGLKLSDQNKVNERFGSSMLARTLVRHTLQVGNFMQIIIPKPAIKAINGRFDDKYFRKTVKKDKSISFDLLRASVNLVVASILIAFATSKKLPLSTTYVTFMVAMGTSLADGAWNRESAVYRITGVVTVIGGWFFTALSAFTAAFVIALFIYWTHIYGIIILVALTAFLIYKTHIFHSRKAKEEKKAETILSESIASNGETIFEKCNSSIISTLLAVSELYKIIINGLIGEKRKKLKKALKETKKLNKEIKALKSNIHITINKLEEEIVESGHHYVQVLDYLGDITHSMTTMTRAIFNHVDNNHAPLKNPQIKNLGNFQKNVSKYFEEVIQLISDKSFFNSKKVVSLANNLMNKTVKLRKEQIKTFKSDTFSTSISLLYLDILVESKNLILYTTYLLKASKGFIRHFKL
ncbi:MAG: inorganic phosphate transporter [Bacteroidales bacterium]|nr:MAG: inorganic phosphate transporter [Bacteroidales bacterium]